MKFRVEDVNISENNYNVYRQCQNFKAKETDSEMVCNTPLNILEEKNIYVVSPMFLTSDRLGLSSMKMAITAANNAKSFGVILNGASVSVITAWRRGKEENKMQ